MGGCGVRLGCGEGGCKTGCSCGCVGRVCVLVGVWLGLGVGKFV